ncbi:MAG: 6-hydroxymethylpterin diphosphokinase MptE-like protein [Treponemataceae bacterium]
MFLTFSKACNGEDTCNCKNVFLHSKYNPSAEAQKWIESQNVSYNVSAVIAVGICIPYSLKFLKQKFPEKKIIVIQYSDEFKRFESDETCNFLYIGKNSNVYAVSEFFFNLLGEEYCSSLFILSWLPAEKIFTYEATLVKDSLKIFIEKSKNIIATRSYFSKKWFSNSIRFFCFVNHCFSCKKINMPVLISASGPTLKEGISFIKKFRKNFFLLSVSSGLNILLRNQIIPDAVISTDGGYWAKRHFDCIFRKYDIPILCSSEAAIPFVNLKNNQFLPLIYEDFINKSIFTKTNIDGVLNARNGSVSGNAVDFALNFTTNDIYTVGLDLENLCGFVHSQPNELEIISQVQDYRIKNKETRISSSNINYESLSIYKNWFSTLPIEKAKRIKRLCTEKLMLQDLGNIKTENWNNIKFLKEFSNSTEKKQEDFDFILKKQLIQKNNTKSIILHFLKDQLKKIKKMDSITIMEDQTTEILKNFAIGDMILFSKYRENIHVENAKRKTVKILEDLILKYE